MLLFNYNSDGASFQSVAVLAYMKNNDGIESSWNGEHYLAQPRIDRWENCREQGYIVSMRNESYHKQINIAFFEHRISDEICAIEWNQVSVNSLTIDTAKCNHDIAKSVKYGMAEEMAAWIFKELIKFWDENRKSHKEKK